jgi:hypothetical protein
MNASHSTAYHILVYSCHSSLSYALMDMMSHSHDHLIRESLCVHHCIIQIIIYGEAVPRTGPWIGSLDNGRGGPYFTSLVLELSTAFALLLLTVIGIIDNNGTMKMMVIVIANVFVLFLFIDILLICTHYYLL